MGRTEPSFNHKPYPWSIIKPINGTLDTNYNEVNGQIEKKYNVWSCIIIGKSTLVWVVNYLTKDCLTSVYNILTSKSERLTSIKINKGLKALNLNIRVQY